MKKLKINKETITKFQKELNHIDLGGIEGSRRKAKAILSPIYYTGRNSGCKE